MKLIYVDTPLDESETPKWCVHAENTKLGENFRDFIERKWNYVKRRPFGENITGFYIYDIQPIGGLINTNKGAMIIRYDWIREE